jgi:hypothetical protein
MKLTTIQIFGISVLNNEACGNQNGFIGSKMTFEKITFSKFKFCFMSSACGSVSRKIQINDTGIMHLPIYTACKMALLNVY